MINTDAISGESESWGAAEGMNLAGTGSAGGSQAGRGPTCASDEKACEVAGTRGCFSTGDPDLGCSNEGCAPCALPHALAACGSWGGCRISECIEPYQDCDADPRNGCEVDASKDPDNCSACAFECSGRDDVTAAACVESKCQVAECATGFGDCNGRFDDGCEVHLLTSEDHCGRCNQSCRGTCTNGSCSP